ncbi:MAG: DUF72 domain-containing protein [Armatimonadota bacterium]|nr:DUF72 domain-containing protein [Armatimonadota bacterium]
MSRALYAGTSGFSYPEWRGTFYPADLPADQMLAFYSRAFPTVELNTTFYRFPRRAQVDAWRLATPPGFRFAVKVHRTITHLKRLRDVDELVSVQLERARWLDDRLGPLLVQLPPSLRRDLPLLRAFLALFPPMALAVEFRHASWHTDEVYTALDDAQAALVVMEADDDPPVLRFVGPFAYLRLHRSGYGDDAMAAWAARVVDLLAQGRDVYAYFTHEDGAPAPAYAQALARRVAQMRGTAGGSAGTDSTGGGGGPPRPAPAGAPGHHTREPKGGRVRRGARKGTPLR